jgi:uncharacterized protein (TIGR03067 family)
MRRCVLLAGVGLSLALAPAPLPKPGPGKDLKAMQGRWKVLSQSVGGAPVLIEQQVAVTRGSMLSHYTDGGVGILWHFTLHPRTTPKTFTMTRHDGRRFGGGTYTLKGDTLTWCYTLDNNERPRTSTARSRTATSRCGSA